MFMFADNAEIYLTTDLTTVFPYLMYSNANDVYCSSTVILWCNQCFGVKLFICNAALVSFFSPTAVVVMLSIVSTISTVLFFV